MQVGTSYETKEVSGGQILKSFRSLMGTRDHKKSFKHDTGIISCISERSNFFMKNL